MCFLGVIKCTILFTLADTFIAGNCFNSISRGELGFEFLSSHCAEYWKVTQFVYDGEICTSKVKSLSHWHKFENFMSAANIQPPTTTCMLVVASCKNWKPSKETIPTSFYLLSAIQTSRTKHILSVWKLEPVTLISMTETRLEHPRASKMPGRPPWQRIM